MSRRVGTVLVAALAGLTAAWWVGRDRPIVGDEAGTSRHAASAPSSKSQASAAAPPAVPAPRTATQVAAATAVAAPEITCPHQRIELASDNGVLRACVGAPQTDLNGDVRSYRFEPEGVSAWTLELYAVSGKVFEARLTDGAVSYLCKDCNGFTIGKPDRHGARSIHARDATLRRTDGSDALRLTATLAVAPHETAGASACALGASVAIVESSGSVGELCASSSGISFLDSGERRYAFSDHDGRHLHITLTTDGALSRVDLDGWSCEQHTCGGIAMQVRGDPADPSAERWFSFSGATLFAPPPSRHTATLNGHLTMPAQ